MGDYDGDGHDDLFVAGSGQTVLYRNEGNGTFRDVTERAGVLSTRWTTAAGFADLDGDGDLDLVSVTYVDADPSRVPDCRDQQEADSLSARIRPHSPTCFSATTATAPSPM
ncbi:MAG: VCBS repeat-containing protein [Isosphaeraceae bacterium]